MRSQFQEVEENSNMKYFQKNRVGNCICKLISENALIYEILNIALRNLFLFHIKLGLESWECVRRDPSRWPRGILYLQKLALTSPTSGGRSVGIVRSRTQATEFSFFFSFFSSYF
jgi:hypothetical protein